MKLPTVLLLSALLTACASVPPPAATAPLSLFHDELFGGPSERADASSIFALDDQMRQFLQHEITEKARKHGAQMGLLEALYDTRQLKLSYDAGTTRNAAQAFHARAGNCLSLVIMTAAFAKELGLPVRYQSVYSELLWSRSGGVYFASGHVNVVLGTRLRDLRNSYPPVQPMLIDFLPPSELTGQRTREIGEVTIGAMYMNNKAGEALARGRLDDAYAWAREAVRQDPDFLAAQNTLGVVYHHARHAAEAQAVFLQLLAREPSNAHALSNLALVYESEGHSALAQALRQRLAAVEPDSPFGLFSLGMAAMERGEYSVARDYFARQVDRAPDNHEFHFWLAMANARLGDLAQTRKHLALAMETSHTARDHDVYAAKLAHLRASGLQ
ncbi:hypothetical protein BH11PSE8_BH11PSE8_38520 [soil metagenome]